MEGMKVCIPSQLKTHLSKIIIIKDTPTNNKKYMHPYCLNCDFLLIFKKGLNWFEIRKCFSKEVSVIFSYAYQPQHLHTSTG